jgi:hypothetical protein
VVLGQVGIAVGDGAGVLGHLTGGGGHVAHDAGQRRLHVLHGLQHLAQFVTAFDLDVLRQVAGGDGFGGGWALRAGPTMEREMTMPPPMPRPRRRRRG